MGDDGGSRGTIEGLRLRGIQSPSFKRGVDVFWSFEGDWAGVWDFVGEKGDEGLSEGEGDSGRRKGEVRGEPKDRGEGEEGLYVADMA